MDKTEKEIMDDSSLEEMGGKLTVVDPNYVVTPTDEKEIQSLVGEINGFLQVAGAVQPPKNYDHNGALKSLYLQLIQTHETPEDKTKGITLWNKVTATPQRRLELMTAAREMVMNGVNPNKGQCYFYLAKGGKYKLDMSYRGYEMLAEQNAGVRLIGYVLHDGDELGTKVLDNGQQLMFPNPNPLNRDKPITGAIALAICIKTKQQVDNLYMSWNELCKSRDKGMIGGSPAYKTSAELMYKKLVLKALAKQFYRKTDDSSFSRPDEYFAKGDFEQTKADGVDFAPVGRKGSVTITNEDGTPAGDGDQAEVEYWTDNGGNMHALKAGEFFAPYLSQKKKDAGEKYDGTYVAYCKNRRMAVLKPFENAGGENADNQQ